MSEEIPDNFTFNNLKLSKLIDNCEKYINKTKISNADYMKKNKRILNSRNNFYLTNIEEDGKYYTGLEYITKDEPLDSGIYQYYNETNYFYEKILNYFCLHRLKLNIVLYYKLKDQKTNKISYGFLQAPAELVDIPIATYTDFRSKLIDLETDISQYRNEIHDTSLIFNCYKIYALIDDICKQLFIDHEFPWSDNKYEKKMYRFSYFLLIYLNNAYKNFNEIINKIKEFLITFDTNIEINYVTHNDKNFKDDKLFSKIFKYLSEVYIRVIKSNNDENNKKFEKIKNIIINNIDLFYYEKIDIDLVDEYGVQNVPYLEKYLRYKKKYLELKNKSI